MDCPRCGKAMEEGKDCTWCAEKYSLPPTPIIPVQSDPKQRTERMIGNIVLIIAALLIILVLLPSFLPHRCGGRKAKEVALRGNLQQMRNAIKQFNDDTGQYPAALDDIVAVDESWLTTKVKKGTYKGPYLCPRGGVAGTGVPMNPFSDPADNDTAAHWLYNAKTGKVTVPASQADLVSIEDGKRFRDF